MMMKNNSPLSSFNFPLSTFYDVIIIGGGLLGCFAARNLARYKLRVALLEKREDLCTGISRANTAIVYSGCDTKPGTLKTSMCVRSAQDFALLCDELGVRYSQCGSIMVSFGERGAGVLRNKLETGIENGVRGMRLLTREEVLVFEPNIAANVNLGLFVPDTGTVMPWELCLAAAENAADNGVDIYLNTEALQITNYNVQCTNRDEGCEGQITNYSVQCTNKDEGCEGAGATQITNYNVQCTNKDEGCEGTGGYGYIVRTNSGVFYTRAIINCAGMAADGVFEMLCEPTVRIVPTSGDYFVLDTKAAGHIRHVIFHEPEEKGKGLTLVPTVDGNILVGPTERPGDDFETNVAGMDELRELVSQVIPTLPMEHVIRSFGAVRPNPYRLRLSGKLKVESGKFGTMVMGTGTEQNAEINYESISDFCIIESDSGAFVSLVGVKTPGLTCANLLGMYTADRVAAFLGAVINPDFDPRRIPPVRLSDMSFDERVSFSKCEDSRYGRIVCRCRGVSEGEIVDAIHRFPGATTLDGVKRRTGAGSGRCQSGFCGQSVVELLARELGCAPEEVMKDGEGSYFLINTIRT